jgi:Zn-dependent protease with chaperone function
MSRVVVLGVLLSFFALSLSAGSSIEDDLAAFDRKIIAELRAENPAAAALFEQANAAREKQDAAAAAALYQRVSDLVPSFDHAIRRQSSVELILGHRQKAVDLARKAMALAESGPNQIVLASALAQPPEGEPARQEDLDEALNLTRAALKKEPNDYFALQTLCEVAIARQDLELLREGATKLVGVAPDHPEAHVMVSLAQVSGGDFAGAESSLDRARELGLPEAVYAELMKDYRAARPLWQKAWPLFLWVTIPWVASMLALFIVGAVLSRVTLRAATDVSQPSSPGGVQRFLRKVYAGVIGLSCALYYISIPLIIVLTLAFGAGVIYLCFAIGRIPVKLVVIIGVVVLVSVWSILKSVFVRVKDEEPGVVLDLAANPRLKKLLDDIARKVGTRVVDNVYLTPGTDVAVTERGSLLRGLAGKRERCLILGTGVLDGFRLGPFKAVLAHEYGHFSNKDTAGGRIALAVRISLIKTATHLAEGGAATWYNPAWLFVNAFYRVFLRISLGASRLQEIMADRFAVFTFGAAAFEEGLRHVIARSIVFDSQFGAALKDAVDRQVPVANLYALSDSSQEPNAEVEKEIEEALNRPSSPYDSHPAPAERFRWARLASWRVRPAIDDGDEAWTLFSNREAVERRMTEEVRSNVRLNYGVEILEPEPASL